MKRNLLTILAASAIAGSGFVMAHGQDEGNSGPGGWHHRGNPLDHMSETLQLTPDQKTKVQPILDQAKPQLVAIHQEAMQKVKAVMDKTMADIRPLLTPDQQKKADDLKQAHQDLHSAAKKLHDAKSE
jgi:Spy/CpxP family protein refolding chaperone